MTLEELKIRQMTNQYLLAPADKLTAILLYPKSRGKYRYHLASQLNCFDKKSTKGNVFHSSPKSNAFAVSGSLYSCFS